MVDGKKMWAQRNITTFAVCCKLRNPQRNKNKNNTELLKCFIWGHWIHRKNQQEHPDARVCVLLGNYPVFPCIQKHLLANFPFPQTAQFKCSKVR